jgi:hypothetical protein
MENENKEKKVILTDEELKEVAGGGSQCLPLGSRCSDLPTQYYCVKKEVCAWDKVKNVCTWAIYLK